MRRIVTFFALILILASCAVHAQTNKPRYSLDGSPYTEKEPDIDMYIGTWIESWPKCIHGSLWVREILTPCAGDPLKPADRGAVLTFANRFAYTTLVKHNETVPSTLKGEQELYYVAAGKGAVSGGGKTHDLYPGVAFLIPEGLEFILKNTSEEHLHMYLVVEPTYEGFRPVDHIVVHDEADMPVVTRTSHWVYIVKHLIKPEEGLATLQSVLTVYLEPGTFAQPHSHVEGSEEVWCTVEGDVTVHLGKEIRALPPGSAYMIPADGKTPHANCNFSDSTAKFFFFARYPGR